MPQRVMITAAADGIGRSIARAFHDRGAQVRICDVNEQALASFRKEFPAIGASHVDVRSEDALAEWFRTSLAELGSLDVLVNNAGTKGPTAPVEDVDYADWRACLEVCLDSHFLCAKHAAPVMKAQKSGSIINISSTAGLYGFGNRTPYAAAKWAVIGLTKSLAIELGPHNVRCNAICPGAVRGDRINKVIEGEAKIRGVPFDVVAREMVWSQSISRFVEPEEIADMCVFLASPEARMVNGQAIAVDGHLETMHIR